MAIVAFCHRLGWTYQEYMNQPLWFLELLNLKLELEDDFNKREARKRK